MLLAKLVLGGMFLVARVAGIKSASGALQIGLPHSSLGDPTQQVRSKSSPMKRAGTSGFRYHSNDTSKFLVQSLPDFNVDLGELYAGNVPIDARNPNRSLYFVFQPTIGKPVDEINVIFGCSTLPNFLQETGRWVWPSGVYRPIGNPYSWVNLTNVLWVEGMVGSGYTQGDPVATDHEETSREFIGFLENFQKVFGIKNYKIYLTGFGEPAKAVPYISAAMLESNNTELNDIKGVLLPEVYMDSRFAQENSVVTPFAQYHQHLTQLNSTYLQQLEQLDQKCGYAEHREKYFKFPAAGVQPVPNAEDQVPGAECDLITTWALGAYDQNPCFNQGDVSATCPIVWDVLYNPAPDTDSYFDRADVKQALHVAPGEKYKDCYAASFDWDKSVSPFEHVLPQVIEGTKRVVLANGDLNMLMIANGTLLRIQNMTWDGQLGFQQEPSKPVVIDLPDLTYQQEGLSGLQGTVGVQHFERGLLWVRSFLGKFDAPVSQPRMAYRQLQWVLGRIDEL